MFYLRHVFKLINGPYRSISFSQEEIVIIIGRLNFRIRMRMAMRKANEASELWIFESSQRSKERRPMKADQLSQLASSFETTSSKPKRCCWGFFVWDFIEIFLAFRRAFSVEYENIIYVGLSHRATLNHQSCQWSSSEREQLILEIRNWTNQINNKSCVRRETCRTEMTWAGARVVLTLLRGNQPFQQRNHRIEAK